MEEIDSFDDINSIDKAVVKLNRSLEFLTQKEIPISPEIQFWGHCSNLQAWYENDYNSRLIHSNIAFPLLRKLTEAGDLLAKKVFKEEIAKRFETGHIGTIQFFAYNNYLNFLNKTELECLFEQTSPNLIETVLIQLKQLMISSLTNYRKIKDLIDILLFIDLKYNRTFLIEIFENIPQKYEEQFGKLVLLHLNYKEFNHYKIPYGKFYHYFEHFITFLYENYPYFNELLRFLDAGFYNSSFSLDERLAYGTVSYK
ncbi:MAG: hypothetical protein ACFE94_15695 [Candidatus Hodarchaeota archaeon]